MFENVMPGPVSGLEEDSGVRVYPYEKDHRQQPWQGLRGGFAVLSNGGSPGSAGRVPNGQGRHRRPSVHLHRHGARDLQEERSFPLAKGTILRDKMIDNR